MTHSSSASETNERREPLPAANPSAEAERVVHPLIVRLVEWRKVKDWTQERTAEHLDIPLNTLKAYECGNRNPGGTNTAKILALVGFPKK